MSLIIFLSAGKFDMATFVTAAEIFFTSISMLASSSSSLLWKYVYTVLRLLFAAFAISFIVMLLMPSFENSFLATLINTSLVSIVDIYDDKMIILRKITQMCSFVQKKAVWILF